MSSQEPTLKVQINQIDHTLVPPGPLDNSSLPRVPILRIYGPSSTGEKTCLHVHQVYPYFFVEYVGKMDPESVNRYIAKLSHSLNHAIAVSMKRNPHAPSSQFIRAILLVKGVHFYGFHSSYSPFLKVLLADPAVASRAVTVLRSGNVMHTRFNIYESHLSYILQFLCDFGLYGCGWINLAEVWQRAPEEEVQDTDETATSTPRFNASPYFRESRMPLEVDVVSHQILNRHQLAARELHHKLTIPAPLSPPEPLIISVRELWDDERRRRVARGLSPSPEIPVDPSESSRGPGGEWVAEARWWDEVRKRIEKEREEDVGLGTSSQVWERFVMTTFDSIQALWDKEYKTWKRRPLEPDEKKDEDTTQFGVENEEVNPFEHASNGTGSQQSIEPQGQDIDINEIGLSSQEIDQLVNIEEREWMKLMGETGVMEYGDDGEAGLFDDDYLLPEDGPPPENEGGDDNAPQDSDGSEEDPFINTPKHSSRKRMNMSRDAEDESRRKRRRTAPVISNAPVTPTKPVVQTLIATELIAEAEPVLIEPLGLIPTEPASHMLQKVVDGNGTHTRASTSLESDEAINHAEKNHHSQIIANDFVTEAQIVRPDEVTDCPPNESLDQAPLSSDDKVGETQNASVEMDILHWSSSLQRASSQPTLKPIPRSSHPRLPGSISSSFGFSGNAYVYSIPPPTKVHVMDTLHVHDIPSKIYQDAWYSRAIDAPEAPREYAGLLYHLKGGKGLNTLEKWSIGGSQSTSGRETETNIKRRRKSLIPTAGWEYASSPPSPREVRRWLTTAVGQQPVKQDPRSQIVGPTPKVPSAMRDKTAAPAAGTTRERVPMTVLSLEVFAPNKNKQMPNPDADEVTAAFWAYQGPGIGNGAEVNLQSGIVVVESKHFHPARLRTFSIEYVSTELDLLNTIIDIVMEFDPDIIVGWEVQAASWGYLSARARHYGYDLGDMVSRAASRRLGGSDQWDTRQTSTFKANGRHVLNVWRIMRSEQNLSMYSMENVVFHVLGKRIPRYDASTLTEWYLSNIPTHTSQLLQYMSERTAIILEILEESEFVTKTAEFARVFGVDFFSVISRGSQYKVESFMFRIGKPESLVFLSPSKDDVGKQNAAECMPLIMEPLSAFYNNPLLVLDFQSLYPSIMIAYNYCYSTCLGRVTNFKGRNKFGVTDLAQPHGLLDTLHDRINMAPNGMMYVKPEVRKGLLGRMLIELLETRVMVKQAMKGVKDNKMLKRILDARQLGLKYIANVTYGYTSATYSGRMPAVEIADSIVQSGRETLEKAVQTIDATKRWGAKVVYGDTDSLFISLRGKTKDQAFRIGQDISDTITAMNPSPVKLKFEKVYLPCVLMAKKRYVGFKYENPDDREPVFDAKGIETVRRDGIPAQQKMTETCLKILFRTQDLSEVKEYCCTTWQKILEDRASIQDFIFAKEVKLGTYSDKVAPPPGVAVAARRLLEDHNDEPQYGDRVPYVIVRGAPGSRLVDRAMAPQDLLENQSFHLDATYYISRVLIPPLERIFNLVGADVRAWYDEMPKTFKADEVEPVTLSPTKTIRLDNDDSNRPNIDQHFHSSQCLICGDFTHSGVCDACHDRPQTTITGLLHLIQKGENRLLDAQRICGSCTGSAQGEPIRCVSIDCPWFFERKKAERKADFLTILQEIIYGIEHEL